MRIFHLSDLHIGLKLFQRDLREDHEYVLEQIIEYAGSRKPDVILVAGDIYDKAVPSADAVNTYNWFIEYLRRAAPKAVIMLISGNHDSGPGLNIYRNILSENNIYMIGLPPQLPQEKIARISVSDKLGEVDFYLLPFVNPSMIEAITGRSPDGRPYSYDEALHILFARESIDISKRNVLVSHQFYLPAGKSADEVTRTEAEITTVGNVDVVKADVLEPFDYAALGHIHTPMTVGEERFRYCGTPLACSVKEAGQQKGIIEVELGRKGELSMEVLPLKPLREIRKISGSLSDILAQSCEDYVSVELFGDELTDEDTPMRIRDAFPYLLEIQRKEKTRLYEDAFSIEDEEQDLLSLCLSFLDSLGEGKEDAELLAEVIDSLQGGRD